MKECEMSNCHEPAIGNDGFCEKHQRGFELLIEDMMAEEVRR